MSDDIVKSPTARVVSDELESVLYRAFPVLDHGFIRVVDYMGTDSSIVQAARVSYGSGTKHVSQDRGLIEYLMRHKHTTPFEMCDIKFHIKLPFFVARQWIRHRTASVNEYSGRYSILSNEFYVPKKENISPQSVINKQGREENAVPDDVAQYVIDTMTLDATNCYKHYMDMINYDDAGNAIDEDRVGITRELARINLTLNHYTEWYWKINLHNLLHFLRLRADSHAQYEIMVYAKIMLDIVKMWVPMTYNAFVEHSLDAVHLSKTATSVLKRKLAGEEVTQQNSGLSQREWKEYSKIFDL
jgi:thymidylate synthase (FAD)